MEEVGEEEEEDRARSSIPFISSCVSPRPSAELYCDRNKLAYHRMVNGGYSLKRSLA